MLTEGFVNLVPESSIKHNLLKCGKFVEYFHDSEFHLPPQTLSVGLMMMAMPIIWMQQRMLPMPP